MNLTPKYLAVIDFADELQALYPGLQENYYYHMALAVDKVQAEGKDGRQWAINVIRLDWLDLRRGNTNTEQQRKDEDYFG